MGICLRLQNDFALRNLAHSLTTQIKEVPKSKYICIVKRIKEDKGGTWKKRKILQKSMIVLLYGGVIFMAAVGHCISQAKH